MSGSIETTLSQTPRFAPSSRSWWPMEPSRAPPALGSAKNSPTTRSSCGTCSSSDSTLRTASSGSREPSSPFCSSCSSSWLFGYVLVNWLPDCYLANISPAPLPPRSIKLLLAPSTTQPPPPPTHVVVHGRSGAFVHLAYRLDILAPDATHLPPAQHAAPPNDPLH